VLHIGWIDDARRKASIFVHAMRPSELAPEEQIVEERAADSWQEVEPELQPPRTDSPATRYGVWWHEVAEQAIWTSDVSALDDFFEIRRPMSPDAARSKRDWQLLRQHLLSEVSFRGQIARNAISRTEMPFLWRIDPVNSLEGVVDLALIEPEKNTCRIVDWKTNRIAAGDIDELRTQYRAQIAAYWKAITKMTGMSVDAGIYSTSTGQFIAYERGELAREWQRLSQLPLSRLVGEITEG
jgi:ATP-dependent exoDNAse (exonuclease V) beta subunit